MRIPPYWTRGQFTGPDLKGREITTHAYGWSFTSPEEALGDAEARARRVFDRWIQGQQLDSYEYLAVPLREEIADALEIDGQQEAVITRNRYGALVLNSRRVCFVDVDFPAAPRQNPGGFLGALFGGKSKKSAGVETETLERIRAWAAENPAHSFIVYRTHSGYRLLFTDKLYDAASDETHRILTELGSDALYQKLCHKQQCFRARLTPKPWRIGLEDPQRLCGSYPFATDADCARFQTWLKQYESKSAQFGVCLRAEEIGPPPQNEIINAVVLIHDQYTCGKTGPLA